MCTFYTKNGVFLPGDSRALSALRGACVKFTTQRGVNSVSYLFSSVFRRRDQCLSSLTWCPCIACTGTAIHVWTQTVPSPWADSYLLTLWWGKCGHPSCVPLQQQNSDDSELKDLFSTVRTDRNEALIQGRELDSVDTERVICRVTLCSIHRVLPPSITCWQWSSFDTVREFSQCGSREGTVRYGRLSVLTS